MTRMTRRNKNRMFLTLFLLLFLPAAIIARDIPDMPDPPRLVNDFSGILSSSEADALENKLVAFNDSTSTQISIVIVDDLGGYDKSDYAFRLAEKWGIGQKGLNNGIMILVKPRTRFSSGEAFIATGYGLEGVIPDILCGEITDYEMIPAFRNNDYYGGLDKATTTLMALASGEFTADEYGKKGSGDLSGLVVFIIFVIILIIIMSTRSRGGKNQRHLSNKGLPLWLLLSMMNSGRGSHRGSWGGFSGGGGGGGFGGFGGGSFGGGGAGGSW